MFLRTTWAILRRELLAYFLSPISYIIGALFLVVHGYSFFLLCQILSNRQVTMSAVMQYFFGGTFLYWLFVMFVVSVLSMRLLAEERQQGTLEVLLTAPVREPAVVLGKFLGCLGFYVVLWVPTVCYTLLMRAYAGDPGAIDLGPIAAGYLGTLLCGTSAIALGLLCSSLTRSQVLAAVLAFTVLSLLLLLGMLADLYVRSETGRQVLLYMNLFHHMDEMGRGIVDSRRVVYHLSITVMALFAASRVLSTRSGDFLRGARVALEAGLCLALLLTVNLIAARHEHRADWTRGRTYALSERSVALMDEVRRSGKTVTATVFMFGAGEDKSDLFDDTRELLHRAERAAGGALKVEIIDVDRDRERARLLGDRYHISRDDLRDGVVVVECEGRTKFIQRGDLGEYETSAASQGPDGEGQGPRLAAYRGEEALGTAVLTVLTGKTPQVCFSRGHGEAEYDSLTGAGMSDFSEALRREGDQTRVLDSLTLLLDAGGPGCDLVVMGGPERAVLPQEAVALARYLDGGGRLLLLSGPALDGGLQRFVDLGLSDVLRARGVRLEDAVVLDPERSLGGGLAWTVEEGYADHPVSAGLMHRRTLFTMARPVRALPTVPQQDGRLWSAKELVVTGDKGYGETDLAALREGHPAFTEGKDVEGPVAVAVAASVKQEVQGPVEPEGRIGRMVVIGSSQIATNDGMVLFNRDLLVSAAAWLLDVQRRLIVPPKRPERLHLVLEEAQLTRVMLVTLLGMPLMALLLGVGVFWVRRG